MFFPTINPANDEEFYVSCDMSQLFHSTDFGNSYQQLHFSQLPVLNRSTYQFTNNPAVAYSLYNDGNDGYPVKTINGGKNWLPLAGYDLAQNDPVVKLIANYDNPNQLLLNSYGDIFFSNNGGLSFSLVKTANNNGAGLIMGGVFWDGPNIYIGTNDGLIASVNGGASFQTVPATGIPAGQMIWSFEGAKSGTLTRFVCITADQADVYNGVAPYEYYDFAKGVYTMDNASGTWVSKSNGIDFSSDFIMFAGMARNNTDIIYLGGNDASLDAPLVFKTTNGGNTWAKVFRSENNANIATGWSGYQGDKQWSWGETCFGISVAPNNANKVMFGDFGFVHLSRDGGTSWKQAYVRTGDQHPAGSPTPQKQTYRSIGLENTSCWQVLWTDANTMMAAFSDIGAIRSTDGGQSWGFHYNGFSVNSVYRMLQTPDKTLYAACSRIHDLYQSTYLTDARIDGADASGKIVFSKDNGQNWTTLKQFNHPVFWVADDKNRPNRLYASVVHFGGTQGNQQGGIYKTDDLNNGPNATWTKLPNPPRTEGHPASMVVLNDGNLLCTFSGRRSSTGFTASSGVFRYNHAANTWDDLSHPGMYYWTKDLVLDPNDATQSTWYVAVFSGWGGAPNGLGGLYRTKNKGTSWTKLTDTQFDRVTSVTFNPQNGNEAWLTTETQGLWRSNTMNAEVPQWQLVEAYPFRQPERVYFNPFKPTEMWVCSFGNGMKTGDLAAVKTTDLAVADLSLRLLPNPAQEETVLSFTTDHAQHAEITLTDVNGKSLAFRQEAIAGQNNLKLPLNGLATGIYLVRIALENGTGVVKLVVE